MVFPVIDLSIMSRPQIEDRKPTQTNSQLPKLERQFQGKQTESTKITPNENYFEQRV